MHGETVKNVTSYFMTFNLSNLFFSGVN